MSIISKLDAEDRAWMEQILSDLDHAENDSAYWELVAKGEWPSCKKHGPLYLLKKNMSLDDQYRSPHYIYNGIEKFTTALKKKFKKGV